MSSNNFRVGIEAEVLLRLHNTSKTPKDLEGFSAVLVNYFNQTTIASGCPKMHSDIEGDFDGPNGLSEWSITEDVTIKPDEGRNDQCRIQLTRCFKIYLVIIILI
jgi:hypothetical protein